MALAPPVRQLSLALGPPVPAQGVLRHAFSGKTNPWTTPWTTPWATPWAAASALGCKDDEEESDNLLINVIEEGNAMLQNL